MTYPIKKDFALASGLSRCGRESGALSHRVAANLRARALAPVIREIWAEGFMSYNALSRELNRRQVQPLRSGKQWYPMTAGRVLVRLERTGLIRIRRRPRRGSLLDLALGDQNLAGGEVRFWPISDLRARPLFRRLWGEADISRRIRAVASEQPSQSPALPDRARALALWWEKLAKTKLTIVLDVSELEL